MLIRQYTCNQVWWVHRIILLYQGVSCTLDACSYWRPLVWFVQWLVFSSCIQPLLFARIPDLYVLPSVLQSPAYTAKKHNYCYFVSDFHGYIFTKCYCFINRSFSYFFYCQKLSNYQAIFYGIFLAPQLSEKKICFYIIFLQSWQTYGWAVTHTNK